MNPLYNSDLSRDLLKPEIQRQYVLETHNGLDLLHKELDINLAEQGLLKERIQTMKGLVNDLPSSDSEYSMIQAQIQMDLVELDEIKRREDAITDQLKTTTKQQNKTNTRKIKK